jgi:ubiquinone/menaquinone biosynthesis C-methylase UbiE
MADTRYQLEGNAPQLYELETVHTLGRPLAELMFARVSLHASGRVLAAACRRGVVTCVAVQRYGDLGHAVGVDLNAGMLEVARAHAPDTCIPMNGGKAMCVPCPRWSETGA